MDYIFLTDKLLKIANGLPKGTVFIIRDLVIKGGFEAKWDKFSNKSWVGRLFYQKKSDNIILIREDPRPTMYKKVK